MTTTAPFQLLRTGLIGSIILGLAAGGHLAGGGHLPEPGILAALCALTILPVAAATRFRLSMPVLTGLLGAGRAVLASLGLLHTVLRDTRDRPGVDDSWSCRTLGAGPGDPRPRHGDTFRG